MNITKKELKDVISENMEINLKGLNDGANILSKLGENIQYEQGKTRDLLISPAIYFKSPKTSL